MKFFVALTIIIVFTSPSLARKRQRCFELDHPPVDPTVKPPVPVCQANSTYTDCGTSCPKTCENKDMMIKCIALCKVGCACNDGYVLNKFGKCILPNECPPSKNCFEPNQVYSECGANGCQNTCFDPTLSTRCRARCVPGCVCEEGYLRDPSNNCVLQESCPAVDPIDPTGPVVDPPVDPVEPVCPFNEEFNSCGTPCPTTCANKDDPPTICPAMCVPGCFCKSGYGKNANGVCVKLEDCPKIIVDPPPPPPPACPFAHEAYTDCGTACPLTCENKDNPPLVCTANCVPGCFCESGYVRGPNGDCILSKACPAKEICGKNEVYDECRANMCQNTCEWPNLGLTCKAPCKAGCACAEGYLRDPAGKCVLQRNCPIIDPPAPVCPFAHETYTDCGTACPRTCENKDKTAIRCTKNCVQGCFCDKDYVRGPNGDCILPNACPVKPVCGKNEVYDECRANICQNTCEWPNLGLTCKAPCKAGCACAEGYLRDPEGKCVLQRNCPIIDPPAPVCPFAHEKYTDCGTACPLTCENKDNPPTICTKNCVQGCFCEKGYVRGPKGDCILPKACPAKEICEANEEFSECGANACQNTCENPTLGQLCRGVCTAGCVCKEGFLRDSNKKCVSAKKCTAVKCGKNEKYVAHTSICIEASCNIEERYCGLGAGEAKCLCNDGYVRDEFNKCIKKSNCPPVMQKIVAT